MESESGREFFTQGISILMISVTPAAGCEGTQNKNKQQKFVNKQNGKCD